MRKHVSGVSALIRKGKCRVL